MYQQLKEEMRSWSWLFKWSFSFPDAGRFPVQLVFAHRAVFCLALQVMNLSASTGSLVAITIERYRAICLPFTPPLSKFQAKLTIAVVSMTSFLVALPEVGAYELTPPFGCGEVFPTPALRRAYSLLLFLACYLLPLLFIAPAYTRMIYKLWNDRDENSPSSGVSEDPKSSKRKRNVLKMMMIVVLCYAICMMPTYAMFLWLDFGLTGKYNMKKSYEATLVISSRYQSVEEF